MTPDSLRRGHRRATPSAAAALAVLCASLANSAGAAKVADLYDFGVTDRENSPMGTLALGRNGNFYGEESNDSVAALFEVTAHGKETLLWSGSGYPDQAVCGAGLTLGADGLLYGTCSIWNNNVDAGGAIFQFDPRKPSLGPKVLYTFPPVSPTGVSANPSRLTLGTDGNFYGTAYSGYSGDPNVNGSVFRISPKGQFTTLYTFQGVVAGDGADPSALTLGSDGDFYGVTQAGGPLGADAAGTVFRITPDGAETILASFSNQGRGQRPVAPPTQANDGNFYGSTYLGGDANQGTLFRMTPAGTLTYLHDFNSAADNGGYPTAPLAQGSDGALYAPASDCSPSACGVANLFRLTLTGRYATLYVFPPPCQNCEDIPSSPLTQDTSGGFDGVTQFGGRNGRGMDYRLTDGAPPLIALQSPAAAVGARLGVIGRGFKSATGVAFNGVQAAFTVVGDTYLEATVPAGSAPGYVTVTEPAATLKSAIVFTPQ